MQASSVKVKAIVQGEGRLKVATLCLKGIHASGTSSMLLVLVTEEEEKQERKQGNDELDRYSWEQCSTHFQKAWFFPLACSVGHLSISCCCSVWFSAEALYDGPQQKAMSLN